MNDQTPFLPGWRHLLGPMGSRATALVRTLTHCTLAQIETRFAGRLPATLFAKAARKANSRERIYTQRRTFWCWIWQALTKHTSCRDVVRQLQALYLLHEGPHISEKDGAYCRARTRLPAALLEQALQATAQAAEQRAPRPATLQGRPVKVVDGSTATLEDTPANQRAYPQMRSQKPGCGFPLLRLVALFSLASGAILAHTLGNKHHSELRLFQRLMATLNPQDILLADQGFGNQVILCLLQRLKVDFIARSARRWPGRPGRRQGPPDRRVVWRRRKKRPGYVAAKIWQQLPAEATVRMVRGRLNVPGYRVQEIVLVTTLLDPILYPAADLLAAYARRWRMEMCLDDLKTTLGMATLRCKKPVLVAKELMMYLIAHNLIRGLMVEAAVAHEKALERLSFKGTIDAFREFSAALCQARSARVRQLLTAELLRTLAADLLPARPGRREPRAVKRRHNKYAPLTQPRLQFRDPPKRNTRRSRALKRKNAK